jgi:hypothetical protein
MSQVWGAFGLLDFTVLWHILAWRAFWYLRTVYFFNFQIFFSGYGKPQITENEDTISVDMGSMTLCLCAGELYWVIRLLDWNKWVTFKFTVASFWLLWTLGSYLEHTVYCTSYQHLPGVILKWCKIYTSSNTTILYVINLNIGDHCRSRQAIIRPKYL